MIIDDINLNWSEYRAVNTKNGPRRLRVAEPNPAFWGLWRSRKAELQAAGISCRPIANSRDWEVTEWTDANVQIPAPKVAASLPMSGARLAKLLANFVAPALPEIPWTDEQKEIFKWFRREFANRFLCVIARAGSGKTFTITHGFSQAPEEEILYAVFGAQNQVEAAQKITDPRVTVSTLHSCGLKCIRNVWSNARPNDKDKGEDVERDRIVSVVGRNTPDSVVGAIKRLVSFGKNLFVGVPAIFAMVEVAEERAIECPEFEQDGWTVNRLAEFAVAAMKASMERDERGLVSFDDMVWLPVAMNWVRPSYDLVVVDEYQDMNWNQLLMARGLIREGGRGAFIGDDFQAIYGFRGAARDGVFRTQRELNAQVLSLTITQRCGKAIVAEAVELVTDYKAAPAAPEGRVNHIGDGLLLDYLQPGDAVLSRTNAPLLPICLKLLKAGKSARIQGREVGKQLQSLARSFKARSIPQFIHKVEVWQEKQNARFAGTKHAEAKAEVIADQAACLLAVAENAASVNEAVQRLSDLFQDSKGFQKPAVILSSVHKAKGLEWNRVFIIEKSFKRRPFVDEELNLRYVAITRAKQELNYVHGGEQENPEKN